MINIIKGTASVVPFSLPECYLSRWTGRIPDTQLTGIQSRALLETAGSEVRRRKHVVHSESELILVHVVSNSSKSEDALMSVDYMDFNR